MKYSQGLLLTLQWWELLNLAISELKFPSMLLLRFTLILDHCSYNHYKLSIKKMNARKIQVCNRIYIQEIACFLEVFGINTVNDNLFQYFPEISWATSDILFGEFRNTKSLYLILSLTAYRNHAITCFCHFWCTTMGTVIIVMCKWFKIFWNTTGLSQSHFRNFSSYSI